MPAEVRKKRRWVRRVLITLSIVIGLGVVGYLGYAHFSASDEGPEDFDVYKVEIGDITSRLTETGETFLESTIEVMSKVSGTITETSAEEGDGVEKGHILAVVEPDNTELLRLYGRRAQVANAYVQMVQAKDDLDHQRRLFEKVQGTSRDAVLRVERSLSTATTNFRLALMELHILEKDMEIAGGMATRVMAALKSGSEVEVRRTIDSSMDISAAEGKGFVRLADVRVLAPSAGIVISKGVEVGEMVISGTSALNRGTVLFTIGDLSSMFISSRVSEVDADKLEVGQRVNLRFEAALDAKLTGKIVWISPIGSKAAGASVISFPVKIKLDEACPIVKPGMSCDMDIVTSEEKNVKKVLLESVATEKPVKDEEAQDEAVENEPKEQTTTSWRLESKYVYVKRGETYEKRPIEVGDEDEKSCEVVSGLEEGEEVVKNIDDYEEAQKAKEEKDKKDKGKDEDKKQKSTRRRRGGAVH